MCCFLVPLTEAIATSAYRKINNESLEKSESALKRHVPALEKMLWGGSLMLMVDHAINGELSLSFPFFTALNAEGGFQIMLREMLTVGVPMALVLTAAWAIYALRKERKTVREVNVGE